jgi:ribosomal protein S18 acetylase RimI-like enzyme
MTVTALAPHQAALTTGLLCAAFFEYPVMRFVLGPGPAYADRLRLLIGFFVTARILRSDLTLGIWGPDGRLRAAALVTLPGDRPPPETLNEYREAVWRELGPEARSRYEAFGAAGQRFTLETPHHHLNMIGVDPAALGQGLGRQLLDHIHGLAQADPASAGVTLSTETRANLALYRHFRYEEIGHARVSPELETWARPCTVAAGT